MSGKIWGEVWDYTRASGAALTLLLALADSANTDTRLVWLSVPSLAEKCRCSGRWIRFCTTKLEELGEIEVAKTPTGGNIYYILPYNGLDARAEQHPKRGENIKDPERQRAITAARPKRRRRPTRRATK